MPPNSPQWAIRFAHPNRCADRPLLRRRSRAKFNRRLWSQLDEQRGSQQGGFTTKIHLRVNSAGLPMRTEITPGQTSDYLGFDLVMADNLPEPSVLLADRGYDSDNVRKTMEARDVLPVIPMRKTRKLRVAVDRTLYRLRNLVERCFNRLKNARRVATRYDKTAESFLGFIDITSIRLWLRHLST